jgi:outer membrane protein assembly factor BamB
VVSSPAVSGGWVYVGSTDGKVYALKAGTGAKRWEFATGDQVNSSPAVAGGVVFVGSKDGKIYALDAASGDQLWEYPTGDWINLSSPSVANGMLYVGSYDCKVHCFNVESELNRGADRVGRPDPAALQPDLSLPLTR